jgi:hypothetical protein
VGQAAYRDKKLSVSLCVFRAPLYPYNAAQRATVTERSGVNGPRSLVAIPSHDIAPLSFQ